MRNPRLMAAYAARRRRARLLLGPVPPRQRAILPTGAFLSLPPTDAEPVELAAERLFGRKPVGLWRYATARDETAFYAARWERIGRRKAIRPISWVDPIGWQLKAWPHRRPLFNLPTLERRPDAPVVVCEGEKAARAAQAIFPDHVATTSSGGACEPSRSDWTVLQGRTVLIWPDFDSAGQIYAWAVATRLAALNCVISIVDAQTLAAVDCGGCAQEPAAGWDAADAAAEWSDLNALRSAATNLSAPFFAGPSVRSRA
jgi:putative DNA primase/helicase